MANITPRRNGEFLREVFKLLLDLPEGMQASEILAALGDSIELTEFELGRYPSSPGAPRFHKIVRFATIPTVKAGWLVKDRGTWFLTDDGVSSYQRITDPEEFYREAYRLYQEWLARRGKGGGDDEIEDQEVETARVTFEQAEEDAWREIREYLQSLDPFEFQALVADLLQSMGYHVSWIAPPGKDLGVDIVAYTDPLGTTTPRIKVQVKRLGQRINVEGLRAFMSVLGDDDLGLFVAAGGFTRDAIDEARTQERRKITLIDADRLVELWVEHSSKLSQEAKQRLPLRPIYFLAPES